MDFEDSRKALDKFHQVFYRDAKLYIQSLCPFEIDFTDEKLNGEIYKILSTFDLAEGIGKYDHHEIRKVCKEIADRLIEDKRTEVMYKCCGGRGCDYCYCTN